MADKRINELDAAASIYDNDLFVLEQNGNAMSLSGELLKRYIDRNIASVQITQLAATEQMTASFNSSTGVLTLGLPVGAGITSIAKDPDRSSGNSNVYKITYQTPYGGTAKEPTYFTVVDGKQIASISFLSTTDPSGQAGQPGATDTYRVEYNDGTHGDTFIVRNGSNGQGAAGTATPLMDGTAAVGTSLSFARQDHVHPADTSKVPTSRTVDGSPLSANVITHLKFSNKTVAVSAWTSKATYADFPYRAAITCSGVLSTDMPEVVFNPTDALSGNFCPVCQTYSGGVYIYAASIPQSTVTIPSINCVR